MPKCGFLDFSSKIDIFDYLIVCIPLKLTENGYVEVEAKMKILGGWHKLHHLKHSTIRLLKVSGTLKNGFLTKNEKIKFVEMDPQK